MSKAETAASAATLLQRFTIIQTAYLAISRWLTHKTQRFIRRERPPNRSTEPPPNSESGLYKSMFRPSLVRQ